LNTMSYSYIPDAQPTNTSGPVTVLAAISAVVGVSLLAASGLQSLHTVSNYAVAPTAVRTATTTAPMMVNIPQPRIPAAARMAYGAQAGVESVEAVDTVNDVHTIPSRSTPIAMIGGLLVAVAAVINFGRNSSLAMMVTTGTVKWFNSTKGFGFIAPDDGSADVFCHQTAINSTGFRTLEEGAKVEFDVVTDGGRTSAANVSAPGGEPIEAPPRNNDGW